VRLLPLTGACAWIETIRPLQQGLSKIYADLTGTLREKLLGLSLSLNEDFDVVYASRRTRDGEMLIKKIFAKFGYKVINSLSVVQIPKNTGDL